MITNILQVVMGLSFLYVIVAILLDDEDLLVAPLTFFLLFIDIFWNDDK